VRASMMDSRTDTTAISGSADLSAKTAAAGRRFAGIAVDPAPAALASLAEQGTLRVHGAASYPFAQIADAHRLLEDGHMQGKLVLTLDQEAADG
jgi:NADPH:quinone reductase-like Zn-dependent oxidoreductase